MAVSLTSSVPSFQSKPDREDAFTDYRGDSVNDDNTARHLDSFGKWTIRYSSTTAMQVERLKDSADLTLSSTFIDSGH
jgi:hypothetical protein